MKTIPNFENDILRVSMKIATDFPELFKYLDETPLKTSTMEMDFINNENLNEYYDSLVVILDKYSMTHQLKNGKKLTPMIPISESTKSHKYDNSI